MGTSTRHRFRRRALLLSIALGLCVLRPAPSVGQDADRLVVGQPLAGVVQQSAGADPVADANLALDEAMTHRDRATAELAGLGDRRAAITTRLYARGRVLYRLTRSHPFGGGIGLVGLIEHASRVEKMRRMVSADLELSRGLANRGVQLSGELRNLEAAIAAAQAKVAAAEQLARVAEEQAAAEAMFAAAFESSSSAGGRYENDAPGRGSGHGGSFGVADDEPSGAGFASVRGRLPLPVSVPCQTRDGRREDGPGIEFLVPAGTPVRAVAPGRVAFSDRYGSYGRLVIVDHGDSYYSVYGGLGRVDVRVGDELSAMVRIGDVNAESQPSSLFFEVRRGTRTLDPHAWLGL